MQLLILKSDTKYKKAILILTLISCIIYKFTDCGNIFLTYSKLFAIGHSTMGLVLQDVFATINVFEKPII
jgi:hypothetical protein